MFLKKPVIASETVRYDFNIFELLMCPEQLRKSYTVHLLQNPLQCLTL